MRAGRGVSMKMLPEENIKLNRGCAEKISSYLILADCRLPILKSALVLREDFDGWTEEDSEKIKKHLCSEWTMLRYIYRIGCHKVKNGGSIIPIRKSCIEREMPDHADVWLLEPVKRTDNQFCFNISMNLDEENIRLEILGKGFDISDLNKGIISAQEVIEMPFPLEEGAFGEWWKWAKVSICTQKEYQDSLLIRKKRLETFGERAVFLESFTPITIDVLEKIRHYVRLIEPWIFNSGFRFVNISCSLLTTGRFIFWDIQTPEGKMMAYL